MKDWSEGLKLYDDTFFAKSSKVSETLWTISIIEEGR